MPQHPDDPKNWQGFAFGYGYIKALIQAANADPSRMILNKGMSTAIAPKRILGGDDAGPGPQGFVDQHAIAL